MRFLSLFLCLGFLAAVINPAAGQVIADFETESTQGFSDNGWGSGFTGVERVDDPTENSSGALALNCDAAQGEKGVIQKDNIDPMNANTLSVDVYVPADFPDGAQISLWGQDNVNLSGWNASEYSAPSIEKETWVTLDFEMRKLYQANPGEFNPYDGNLLGKFGLQVYFGSSSSWSGTVYVDNVRLNIPREDRQWILSDFELEELGTAGFTKGWGEAFVDLYWFPDMTERSTGVMEMDMDFMKGTKSAFVKDNIDIKWTETDTGAIAFTFDVYLPFDFPEDATVKIWAQDLTNHTWVDYKYSVSGSEGTQIPIEEWTTISFDIVDAMTANPGFDVTAGIKGGVEIYYTGSDWSGVVLFDNFTLVGLTPPASKLKSPAAVNVTADTSAGAFDQKEFVNKVTWQIEEEAAGSSYNVYASENPITDLTSDDVKRIATELPAGVFYYNHQLYGYEDEKTLYYAVTTKGVDNGKIVETPVHAGQNTSGPVTNGVSTPAVIAFEKSFSPEINGQLDDFEQLGVEPIRPVRAGGPAAESWTVESEDLNFTCYLVMDRDNFYIAMDVVDDQPTYGTQAWEGDGFDIFTGFYDVNQLDALHGQGSIYSNDHADYRLSFAANAGSGAQFQKSGSEPWSVEGMEMSISQSENGYTVEAKIPFESIRPANVAEFEPEKGMIIPLKIDVNDNDGADDPAYSGSNRTLSLHWGGVDNEQNWKRPYAWGQAIIGGQTAVTDNEPNVPVATTLHGNYPNPFNPSTTLDYSVQKKSHVSLVVYDLLGRKVKTLINAPHHAGHHAVVWDGTDVNGNQVGAGVYFATFKTGDVTQTRKMLLVK